jgi:membrane protease subunit HflC
MRFLATLLITLLVLSAIILPQVLVVVDETELAIITRLGDPQRSIRSAGLYVKAPLVDSVTKFEKRLLIFDAPAESLLTSDKKRLIIDVYARGRITDPLLFFQTVRSVTQARSRVIDIVASELRREIAKDLQLDVIKTKREEIENSVRDGVRPIINELGIDVVDVRIKRADFPQAIAGSVYERMKAERKRIADRERAQGAEADLQKRAEVDREAVEIRSEARKEADIIRGEAEAEAIAIFAEALEQDPEFYAFLRSLDAYAMFLGDNTTVVLPSTRTRCWPTTSRPSRWASNTPTA